MRRSILLCAIAAACRLASPGSAAEVDTAVVVAAAPPAAGCVSRRAEASPPLVERLAPGRFRWTPRAGEEIVCSEPGFEPRFADCAETDCRSDVAVRIELEPARRIRFAGPASAAAVIEVRALEEAPSPRSGRSRLVYSEPLREEDGEGLAVSRSERLLRVLRDGASPTTFRIPPDDRDRELKLSPPAPGGELVAALAGRTSVLPVGFVLEREGKRSEHPLVDERFVLASGVVPGEYRLIPKYEGGVEGSPIAVSVVAHRTTERLALPLPVVGGVEMEIEAELCAAAAGDEELQVSRLHKAARTRSVTAVWSGRMGAGECRARIAGLAPGDYQVGLVDSRQAVRAVAEVRVAGEIETVWLERGRARLVGRVADREGESLPGFWIRLGTGTSDVVTRTDEGGEYELGAAPGDYSLAVGGGRHLTAVSIRVTLADGEQRRDIVLDGGVLEVQIRKVDGSAIDEPVQVELQQDDRPPSAGIVTPEDLESAQFVGLLPGRYEVSGSMHGGWATDEPVEAVLTDEEPHASVELVLVRKELEIRVVDESGQPLAGAVVFVGALKAAETAPGIYKPALLQANAQIKVTPKPGHSPVCTEATGSSPQIVESPAAPFSAWIEWPAPAPPDYVIVRGLPGSICGVSFPARRIRFRDGWLELAGLPPGTFTFDFPAGERHTLDVPTPSPLGE